MLTVAGVAIQRCQLLFIAVAANATALCRNGIGPLCVGVTTGTATLNGGVHAMETYGIDIGCNDVNRRFINGTLGRLGILDEIAVAILVAVFAFLRAHQHGRDVAAHVLYVALSTAHFCCGMNAIALRHMAFATGILMNTYKARMT